MNKLIFLILCFCAPLFAKEEHATISLQKWNKKIVISIQHEKGWHTYWKNPGDAGIAESFKFFHNNSPLNLKEYEWPAPKRYIESGDIMTIGYADTQHFFFDDPEKDLIAHIGILICKDICIPQEAKLEFKLNQTFVSTRPIPSYRETEFAESFEELPETSSVPKDFDYYLTRSGQENKLTLHYSLKNTSSKKLPKELPLLTAFPQIPWGFKRETLFLKDQTFYGKTEIDWDGEYQDPPNDLPKDGAFKAPYELKFLLNSPLDNKVSVINLNIKNFSQATSVLDDFYKNLSLDSESTKTKPEASSLLKFIFFAFLGGLILNLMPCVLPVISLKLFGLIKHQDLGQKKLFIHNLSYSLGVISSLMALALVIAGLKATGEEIGWGFQLQSPSFVLVMMIILFILSLNLFGLFEFRTPGGAKFGNLKVDEGYSGDFFSGVLTTILSTPCSAPFLGTALTFAFTSSYEMIFLQFFFIGLGLSLPFLLTAAFPKSLHFLPRPGIWMEKLKYFLGLSLIITIIWLYDVFVSLVDFDKVSWKLNLLFTFWFFAFFFIKKISTKRWLQLFSLMFPIIFTLMALGNLPLRPTANEITQSELWQPWSPESLEELKGKTVFMDFTAEWCLTCKVNKKLVLDTQSFKDFAKEKNLTLLRADWTKRDDKITQFLLKNNMVGVPAYFIQLPDGKLISLGETVSLGKLKQNLP